MKHFPHEIESAIEDAAIDGITPSFTAVFPHRPQGSPTETLCVVYLPTYNTENTAMRIAVRRSISEVAVRQTGARPFRILPLSRETLPKTTLGKLSRAKLRIAFESGAFADYEKMDDESIRSWQQSHRRNATSPVEKALLDAFVQVLEVSDNDIDMDSNLFDNMGVSSVELLKLKSAIEKALDLQEDPITITTIMAHPSIRSLAHKLTQHKEEGREVYDPVVCLHSTGAKTPLWLIHPGVGEVLIFLHLAKHITDRPVYALRARGFDGEPYFPSLSDCLSTYHTAIKTIQPTGPYALLGYSYGGTLAFELSKRLQEAGNVVRFTGVMDQPPHIGMRMRYSDWPRVALTLAQFLSIIQDEGQARSLYPRMRELSQDAILDHILSLTTPEHLEAMAITKQKLANWTALALNNHYIARDYTPRGMVPSMDVFCASSPDAFYAESAGEMLEKHVGKWEGFVKDGEARFHVVAGTHNDMIRPVHVMGFCKKLREVMEARGI